MCDVYASEREERTRGRSIEVAGRGGRANCIYLPCRHLLAAVVERSRQLAGEKRLPEERSREYDKSILLNFDPEPILTRATPPLTPRKPENAPLAFDRPCHRALRAAESANPLPDRRGRVREMPLRRLP